MIVCTHCGKAPTDPCCSAWADAQRAEFVRLRAQVRVLRRVRDLAASFVGSGASALRAAIDDSIRVER